MRPSSSPPGHGRPILGSSPVRSSSSFALGSTISRSPSSSRPRASPSSPPSSCSTASPNDSTCSRPAGGVDPRQQTLRATIEWSYDLLDEKERFLLERLSVFRGGCTLEAAEEIGEADIDTLQSLIDKSLLRRQGERFWMLETIREYASERLERHGEAVVLADRHANYFIALAGAAAQGVPDDYVEQGRRLYPELDNLRGALDWLVASGDVGRELRLATGAFWCLWTRSSVREMQGWLASALERAPNADAHLRGDALGAAALAAANLGEAEVARAYARESLALALERNDKRQIEWALRVLSFDEPDLEERRRLLHECERLLRELGDDAGLAWVTFLRGMTFVDEGSFDAARETLEQAAALFRELGRRWEATNAEITVGYTLLVAGQHAEARPLLEGALANAVDLGSPGRSWRHSYSWPPFGLKPMPRRRRGSWQGFGRSPMKNDARWILDTRAVFSRQRSGLRASASDSGSRLSGRRGQA